MNLSKTTLKGSHVILTPLHNEHRQGLLDAALDGELHKLWFTSVPNESNIDSYIATALQEEKDSKSMPSVVLHKTSGEVIGCTRFCNIDTKNLRLEIGYTWYAKSAQRTAVNTETKLLLLQYAFESLQCIAVEFRTHWFNYDSRNAILRLGAKQDGVLRNHRITKDGILRDTVVFSIINSEWPAVKTSLRHKLK